MQYTLRAPAHLHTSINLPASKSISNRALIINALAGGTCSLQNLSDCDDTNVLVAALRDMPDVIDIKASGSSLRFLAAYLSMMPGTHILTGSERIRHRPMKPLVDALRYLGADIEYINQEGFAPLMINGRELDGGRVEVDASVSSQITSALLLIGPALKNGLELVLQGNIVSRSYIDLTLHIMHDFGMQADWTDYNVIATPHQTYRPHSFIVENDWSASSYWYEMMALSDDIDNEIQLTGLMDGSRQGDSVVRYLFSMLGVKTTFEHTEHGEPTTVTLRKMRTRLPRLDYDFVNQPDLAQTFVVCCAGMGIPFHFKGLSTLKVKETDRIEALITEMRKLGFVIENINDCEIRWQGERCQPTMRPIDTYDDHRMALSFAPLCFKFPGLRINDPFVVSKSYPVFWHHLGQAGFNIQISPDPESGGE